MGSKELGTCLKTARIYHDYTQEALIAALAKDFTISRRSLQNYEAGRGDMPLFLYRQIEQKLPILPILELLLEKKIKVSKSFILEFESLLNKYSIGKD